MRSIRHAISARVWFISCFRFPAKEVPTGATRPSPSSAISSAPRWQDCFFTSRICSGEDPNVKGPKLGIRNQVFEIKYSRSRTGQDDSDALDLTQVERSE